MKFNSLVDNILEDFRAPVDVQRPGKVKPRGKFGTNNPQLNEPHSTKPISGFKGQPGGKIDTLFIKLPTNNSKRPSKKNKPTKK